MNDDQRLIKQPQGSQASIIPDNASGNHENGMASQKTQRPTATTAGVGKKPPASSRKIEANRRNASKSTGPRTEIGKRTVARNALKHGFFSKWLLILHPDGKEDPTEYENFYAALREHYEPLDFLEELWVEKIASGPGVCADFYDVRAVKSPEPWPSTITRLSSSCQQQPQESWSCQH